MDTTVIIELGKMLVALAALVVPILAAMQAAEQKRNWRGV